MANKNETSGLITSYINKNADCPHIITNNHLNKLIPLDVRASAIRDELMRIFDKRDRAHFETLVDMILCNPNTVVLGGSIFEMGSIANIRSIDSKLESKVTERIRERDAKLQVSNTNELFLEVLGLLWMTDRTKMGQITQKDYIKARIQFSIEPKEVKTRGDIVRSFRVMATKYIAPYRIRYESPIHPNDERYNGAWDMGDCIIGIEITGKPGTDGKYRLGYDPTVVMIYPRPYIHPFVSDNGGVCLGTFTNSTDQKKIARMPFLSSVYHYLNQIEHMFKTGYSERERHNPLRAHLHSVTFNKVHAFHSFEEEREDWIKKATTEIDGLHDAIRRINKKADRKG